MDGVSIMSPQIRDSCHAHKDLSHFVQLLLGLLKCNTMNTKATLGVIYQTEILSSFVNADDIHKTSGIGYISLDLAINLSKWLYADLLYFISCKDILQSVPYENEREKETFSQLVGTSR